jgi:hypothetical protein
MARACEAAMNGALALVENRSSEVRGGSTVPKILIAVMTATCASWPKRA